MRDDLKLTILLIEHDNEGPDGRSNASTCSTTARRFAEECRPRVRPTGYRGVSRKQAS